MTSIEAEIRAYVERPFGLFAELFRLQAQACPEKTALICGDDSLTYRQLDDLADRIASFLQQDSVGIGGAVALEFAVAQPHRVGRLILSGVEARFRANLGSTVARGTAEPRQLQTT